MNTITRVKKLKEVNNDMVHNYYYLIYARLYNEDGTRYRKIHFVNWFDACDLMEYYEKEFISLYEIEEYNKEIAYSVLDIGNYDNFTTLVEYANETIERYNGVRA